MYRLFFVFVFSACFFIPSRATKISGTNTGYANQVLSFYRYTNPVSKNKELVFEAKFNNEGKFISEVNVKKTTFVFADFGIYRGMLVIEPNTDYELILPPFRDKSFAEQKNPFFKPLPFWIKTKNTNDLVNQISDFDNRFNQLSDEYFNLLFFRQSKEIYDSVCIKINTEFKSINNPFFVEFKRLKIKSLETDAFRLSAEKVWKSIKNVSPDYWNQPAFYELLDKTLDNKLSFEARGIKGKEILLAVAKQNISFLTGWVKNNYDLHGELADIVLIKLLHDAYYSADFAKSDILGLLKSTYFANNKSAQIKNAVKSVLQKITHLQPGTVAPTICLDNFKNEKICTNKNNKKYKYLIFADAEIAVNKEHLKYLPEIEKKFQKYLDIYIIFRPTNTGEIKKFIDEFDVPGEKLLDKDEVFIQKYKVKSFPQCFLLNENHEVVFSDTRAPLDGFEQQFAPYLQQKLFERLRNQSR